MLACWVDTGLERYSAQVLLAFSLHGVAPGRGPRYVPQRGPVNPVCLTLRHRTR